MIIIVFSIIIVLFFTVAVLGYFLLEEVTRKDRLTNRLQFVTVATEEIVEDLKPAVSPVIGLVSTLGMLVARSGLLSRKTLSEMTATLEAIGFRGGRGLGLFIGTKLLLFLITPAIVYFALRHYGTTPFFVFAKILGGAVVGLLAPETIATNIRTRHLKKVESGVADALDMMVICADSGLALEASIARVAQELIVLNPALSSELTQTSQALTIGTDMRNAMEDLGQRTGIDSLKRLATTLIQSLQYGTPLTQALRTLSAELRQEALIKFEERAGKLPTLMTIPMILFILPCVFLIVAGPAMINVLATLHGMK
ncbi:MAG: type II secretion system F family protein [Acidocella sp.]|nr:type II secretion system F family protein [Acidocella sp.]